MHAAEVAVERLQHQLLSALTMLCADRLAMRRKDLPPEQAEAAEAGFAEQQAALFGSLVASIETRLGLRQRMERRHPPAQGLQ